MAERWEFYFDEQDGLPALIAANLGLAKDDRHPLFPDLVLCHLPISERGKNLLPTGPALDIIQLFENAAERVADEAGNAIYAGRLCAGERATLCFYAAYGPALAAALAQSAGLKAIVSFECETRSDPEWTHYFESLYPSPEARNVMDNNMIRDALKEDGDDGTVARIIEHWAYFEAPQSADHFADWLREHGFETINLSTEPNDEGNWVVQFEGSDAPSEIDSMTWAFKQTALGMGGYYDGWETGLAPGVERAP
jgi:uncharacterized protein (TIGR01619 family)